jgi:hypothetical protein
MREEILETFGSPADPKAIVTRNRYGAKVLNAARLLFLDIDLPPASVGKRLGRFFGGADPDAAPLAKLRDTLTRVNKGTFRIYRTAAGLRALAIDREFDPAGHEARDLMTATGTDPNFIKLCQVQKSFRARLTPKPWRCGLKPPPVDYPRDAADEARFAEWLAEYEEAAANFATCKYLESAGKGGFGGNVEVELIALHDRLTRSAEPLPLA